MQPVSSVIYSLFRGSPRHDEWVVACLEGAWTGLLGERLATACKPVRFERSSLLVEVLDEAWIEPLRSCSAELLARIRTATGGEVQCVDFRLRPY